MKDIINKARSFRHNIKQNGIKTQIRRIKNYIKHKKAVLDEYEEWMLLNEPKTEKLAKQKDSKLVLNTKFTIISSDKRIKEKIQNQTYSNYEIKILESKNYYENIKKIDGDYCIFIGKDIKLLPFTLYEIASFIECNECNLIYADNDYIQEGKRVEPEFKPHFAYDNILSKNYFGNFIVVKTKFLQENRSILKNINELETIYNIILRTVEKTKRIMHIDKVLFSKEKEEIYEEEQIKVIEEYLNNKKISYDNVQKGKFEGQYKINYSIVGEPKISIIIPNMDHAEDLDIAVQSILKSTYLNYEIIIVENNSKKEETFKYYDKIKKQDTRIKVEEMQINEFNYSKIVNFGVSRSEGEYIVLLNNDIEVITTDWLEQMLMYVQRKGVGMCGVKMYFSDRTIQHAGVTIGIRGLAGHKYRELPEEQFGKKDSINYVQNLSAVTAACCMVSKKNYEKLLGFDEKLAVAFNDIDFCLKIRKEKLLIVYNPFVELYHYESKSRGQDDTKEKQKRFAKEYGLFVKRWAKTIQKLDPYFNINYRLDTDIPTINYNKIEREEI